ncbi:pyridine nucleotide-disulfide oxidoreductase [Glutamicibacter uratoxydans]|uniref:Pyridine nucleotide-disulfide oxidoreductase n=1 Tax=Glutamicibacter uratoxydans TaxID=43667 RepID=A0A4Y4DP50_GLUUR|nr:FAD-dependent oxidoreductase [Glutamicibacter uratoxydans]GED05435.1 pyridine nucleotide-disulfide oxidoreductase [Glutamicibacter uratoxydans]
MEDRIVIIGAGHAGVQLAASLREAGHRGPLTLISQESALPYQRPPLSKDFVAAYADAEPLALRPEDFYRGVDLVSGARAESIDRAARVIRLDDGTLLGYDRLVFATGARNRPLPCEGGELQGVLGLRTLQDAQSLQRRLNEARRVVVIGAGFIGLEFAAAARARGLEVTVLEFAQRPLGRAASEPLSSWFLQAHSDNGIDLRCGEGVRRIRQTGSGLEVDSAAGSYPADLVVYGIGVQPNSDLAEDCGLACENGILVDEALQTSDPRIFAIGDCASFPLAGKRVRLESVQNANDQARTLAHTLTGVPQAYAELPWFWSAQGEHRLQIAGLSTTGDEPVILGAPQTGKFSIALFREGMLVAVESVNKPADHIAARKLLGSGAPVTAAMVQASASLKDLLRNSPIPA